MRRALEKIVPRPDENRFVGPSGTDADVTAVKETTATPEYLVARRAGLRATDAACRYGDEEFAVILAETDTPETAKRADDSTYVAEKNGRKQSYTQ